MLFNRERPYAPCVRIVFKDSTTRPDGREMTKALELEIKRIPSFSGPTAPVLLVLK